MPIKYIADAYNQQTCFSLGFYTKKAFSDVEAQSLFRNGKQNASAKVLQNGSSD